MITLRIEDMTCGGCAGRIARAIAGLDPQARGPDTSNRP